MNLHKDNRDNRGSTLILVIVCMLIVGIIASLILVYTSHNLKMMKESAMTSENFYTAENVVDEFKTRLEEVADQAVRTAYTKWLQEYTLKTADQQEELFKNLFVNELDTLLNSDFLAKYNSSNPSQLLYKFGATDVARLATATTDKNGTTLTLKNISISYTDADGMTSEISTDLVFNITYPGFRSNTVKGTNLESPDYIIISDEQITNDVTIPIGKIKGNMYGGGYNPAATTTDKYTNPGIRFNANSYLQIYADKIMTRTTIELADRTSVNIKGLNGEYDYTGTLSYSNLWANNLRLTGLSSKTDPVELLIQGNCYLADDLTLDAEASSFRLKGTYYGYHANNAYLGKKDDKNDNVQLVAGTPEGSSSIVLNGKDSILDLSEATKIWIAGKTFVSVPSKYGPGASSNISVGQGEAISYRGLQAAYLLPGDCIKGIGHNPMTEEEYIKYKSDPTNCYVDVSVSRRNGGIRLENYVDRIKPVRIASVDYTSSYTNTKIFYFYLNFQSADKAAKYFEDYITYNGELVSSRMTMLGDGKILFDPAVLENTGNVIGYNENTLTYTPGEHLSSDPLIEDKQIELSTKFIGLTTSLDENYTGAGTNGFLTDHIVNMSMITNPSQVETDLHYKPDSQNYYLITGNDVTINTSKAGIIIAKGNVYIKNSASFTGLIVARGKVVLQGNVKLTADPDNIGYLMKNDPTVAPYFNLKVTSGTSGSGTDIFASDLISISYENWRKN